jgi:hypothetical protein
MADWSIIDGAGAWPAPGAGGPDGEGGPPRGAPPIPPDMPVPPMAGVIDDDRGSTESCLSDYRDRPPRFGARLPALRPKGGFMVVRTAVLPEPAVVVPGAAGMDFFMAVEFAAVEV